MKPPEGYVIQKLVPSEQLIDTSSASGFQDANAFRIPEFNGTPDGYSRSEY